MNQPLVRGRHVAQHKHTYTVYPHNDQALSPLFLFRFTNKCLVLATIRKDERIIVRNMQLRHVVAALQNATVDRGTGRKDRSFRHSDCPSNDPGCTLHIVL